MKRAWLLVPAACTLLSYGCAGGTPTSSEARTLPHDARFNGGWYGSGNRTAPTDSTTASGAGATEAESTEVTGGSYGSGH